MATESDLMIHYTDSLLHGGDFGELDKELLTVSFYGFVVKRLLLDYQEF